MLINEGNIYYQPREKKDPPPGTRTQAAYLAMLFEKNIRSIFEELLPYSEKCPRYYGLHKTENTQRSSLIPGEIELDSLVYIPPEHAVKILANPYFCSENGSMLAYPKKNLDMNAFLLQNLIIVEAKSCLHSMQDFITNYALEGKLPKGMSKGKIKADIADEFIQHFQKL